jgi:hypothetical protein
VVEPPASATATGDGVEAAPGSLATGVGAEGCLIVVVVMGDGCTGSCNVIGSPPGTCDGKIRATMAAAAAAVPTVAALPGCRLTVSRIESTEPEVAPTTE